MNEIIIGENKIGYKGFNVDENNNLYCEPVFGKRKYYKVGEIANTSGKLKICNNGIHFCWQINDVHNHYDIFNKVICRVEILGEVINDTDMKKSCTNKLKILDVLTKEQILSISNNGKDNFGICNAGDWNIGDCNTGDCNIGDKNTGDYNIGICNTGNYNIGHYNTGSHNIGNHNRGSWNEGSGNIGYFNTLSPNVRLFNKDTNISFYDFVDTDYFCALFSSNFPLTEWIYYTKEEKANDKAKELIGGYLKQYDFKEASRKWWNNMSEDNKQIVQNIPNFDKTVFEEITGIKL